MSINKDGTRIYLSLYRSFQILERNLNNTYSEVYSKSFFIPFYRCIITEDESMLIIGFTNGVVEIYRNDSNGFTLNQTINDSDNNEIYAVTISEDNKKIASSETSVNKLRIYEEIGNQFILKQTISVSIFLFSIYLSTSSMIINGFSSQVFVYEFNGSYVLTDTIQTNETAITDIKIEGDLSKIALGGSSQNLSIFIKENETYSLS